MEKKKKTTVNNTKYNAECYETAFDMFFNIAWYFMPKLKVTCLERSIYMVSVQWSNTIPCIAPQKDVLQRKVQDKIHSKSWK